MEQLSKIFKALKGSDFPVVHGFSRDKFKVLISAILSARTRDEITLEVSERLFSKVKSFEDLSKLSILKIEKLIFPVNFYQNKSKNLKKLSLRLKGLDVPSNMEELLELPGVGRKTANLVLEVGFGKDSITVDTHVHRIFNRLGIVRTTNPTDTEMELRKKLPKKYWKDINKYFVTYGQNICRPISPFCSKCFIKKYCKRVNVVKSR